MDMIAFVILALGPLFKAATATQSCGYESVYVPYTVDSDSGSLSENDMLNAVTSAIQDHLQEKVIDAVPKKLESSALDSRPKPKVQLSNGKYRFTGKALIPMKGKGSAILEGFNSVLSSLSDSGAFGLADTQSAKLTTTPLSSTTCPTPSPTHTSSGTVATTPATTTRACADGPDQCTSQDCVCTSSQIKAPATTTTGQSCNQCFAKCTETDDSKCSYDSNCRCPAGSTKIQATASAGDSCWTCGSSKPSIALSVLAILMFIFLS